jgi:hypothetical protein
MLMSLRRKFRTFVEDTSLVTWMVLDRFMVIFEFLLPIAE